MLFPALTLYIIHATYFKCGSYTCGLLFHCANAPWIKFSIFIHFIAPWRLSRISVMQVVLFPVCRKSVTVVMGLLAGANNSLMCWSKGESVFCVSPGDTQNNIIYCSLLLGFKGSHLELCQMCFVVKTLSLRVCFVWVFLGCLSVSISDSDLIPHPVILASALRIMAASWFYSCPKLARWLTETVYILISFSQAKITWSPFANWKNVLF